MVQLGLDAVLAGTPSSICKTKARARRPRMTHSTRTAHSTRMTQRRGRWRRAARRNRARRRAHNRSRPPLSACRARRCAAAGRVYPGPQVARCAGAGGAAARRHERRSLQLFTRLARVPQGAPRGRRGRIARAESSQGSSQGSSQPWRPRARGAAGASGGRQLRRRGRPRAAAAVASGFVLVDASRTAFAAHRAHRRGAA